MSDYYSRKEARHAPIWPWLVWTWLAGAALVVLGLLVQVLG